jgi:cytochrome c553
VDAGEEIATSGIPTRRLPSCADCHGPGPGERNPAYPLLHIQHADYLALQLELFKERRRGGSSYAHIMNQVAASLTPAQLRDVAAYYGSPRSLTAVADP